MGLLEDIYQNQLGRASDAEGKAYWQKELDSGKMTIDQVRQSIRSSDEAKQYRFDRGQKRATQHKGKSPYAPAVGLSGNTQQIHDLYRLKLGRQPDHAGLAYWEKEANEKGIDFVKTAFENTEEAKGYQSSQHTLNGQTQPQTQYTTTPVTPTSVQRTVKPNETTQGQLSGLLQKGSPLLERARYNGRDSANSRGLLNSSMGSEAAEAAMLDASLRVAGADAQTYYDQSKTNQGYANQFNLNAQQNQFNTGLNEQQFKHNTALNDQSTENSIKQGAYDVTANTQGAYLSAIDKITNNAAVSINEIETSQNIPQEEKDKMIANTVARRNSDLDWTRKLYSNMPTWDMSWVNLETMPAAPGVA